MFNVKNDWKWWTNTIGISPAILALIKFVNKPNKPSEAFKIIEAGRKNLTVAQTKLNNDSSRSHCIFTIKICRELNKRQEWYTWSMLKWDISPVDSVSEWTHCCSSPLSSGLSVNFSKLEPGCHNFYSYTIVKCFCKIILCNFRVLKA